MERLRRLEEREPRVRREEPDQVLQEFRPDFEVRVHDREDLDVSRRPGEDVVEGARLVPPSVGAVDVADPVRVLPAVRLDRGATLVRGVVRHDDREAVGGVVEAEEAVDHPEHDVRRLVEDSDLNLHARDGARVPRERRRVARPRAPRNPVHGVGGVEADEHQHARARRQQEHRRERRARARRDERPRDGRADDGTDERAVRENSAPRPRARRGAPPDDDRARHAGRRCADREVARCVVRHAGDRPSSRDERERSERSNEDPGRVEDTPEVSTGSAVLERAHRGIRWRRGRSPRRVAAAFVPRSRRVARRPERHASRAESRPRVRRHGRSHSRTARNR